MVATFSFAEKNGASPGTWTGSISNLNFGNTDQPMLVTATYPITVGNNSYEKYVAGSFGGAFTKISNVQFWMSAGSYGAGEVIKWSGSVTTYATPTATTSVVAVGSVPTSDPGTANVSVHGALTGSLLAAGSTDFITLQYQTTSSAGPGPVNQKTFTIQWDEQ